MSQKKALGLFAAYGVEIEYAIVAADSLDVLPISDEVLRAGGSEYVSEIEKGALNWSNELVLHVLELKTAGPAPRLEPLTAEFQEHVGLVNARLAAFGGRLLPTAMHPWMDPATEMRVWPHDYSDVYDAFHRIFDCRGHGWSNLQSVHLNLPFANDEEFARLHAAIRLLLPLMPALAASSPIVECQATGNLDSRLDVYRTNSRRIPSVAGLVIPEPVYSAADYESKILQPMYAAIAPYDPAGALQFEWLNARGAIARFDRHAIEIRVLDVQENPAMDLAVVGAIATVLKELTGEKWTPTEEQQGQTTDSLHAILLATIRDGERAVITDATFLRQFGWKDGARCSAGELWSHLAAETGLLTNSPWSAELKHLLAFGPLARRILKRLGGETSRPHLTEIYRELCDCLATGGKFA
jgi:gamma-glutamyl:cysteine ligase YbdK (ATP-grasp superfamily)